MNKFCLLTLNELTAAEEALLPEVIPVANYGENHYTKGGVKGMFTFAESDADAVISEFERRKLDIPIDYDHQSVYSYEAPAAGWIDKLEKTKDGLVAKVKHWTKRAEDSIKSKEYRYYSPAIKLINGKAKFLHSLGLTNKPALDAIISFNDNDNNNNKESDMKEIILKALGLETFSENSEEDITKAVKAKLDELAKTKTETEAFLKLHECEKLDLVTAKIQAMCPVTEKQKLEAEISKGKAEQAVTLAMSEGKVSEAYKNWAVDFATKDIAAFSEWVKGAPKFVPDNKNIDQAENNGDKSGLLALSEGQKEILKGFGYTEEELKKISKQ